MDEKTKAELEELETLREVALFGEEDRQDEAEIAYEELRDKLFTHGECEPPGDNLKEKEAEDGK